MDQDESSCASILTDEKKHIYIYHVIYLSKAFDQFEGFCLVILILITVSMTIPAICDFYQFIVRILIQPIGATNVMLT